MKYRLFSSKTEGEDFFTALILCVRDFESFVALWAENINTVFWTANRRNISKGFFPFEHQYHKISLRQRKTF